jgi:Fe-S cluster assembly protein SufD
MTTAPPSAESRILELYDKFPHSAPFRLVNEEGVTRLREIGFPKKKHEMFTYVDFRGFVAQDFKYVKGPEKPPSKEEVKHLVYAGCEKSLVVMLDGGFSAALSDLSAYGGALTATALDAGDVRLSEIRAENDAFACVNAIFLTGGVKISAEGGRRLDVPLQILNLSTGRMPAGGGVPAYVPRVAITTSPGTQATVFFKSCGLAPAYLVDGVISADLGEGSALDLTMIQADSSDAHLFLKTRVRQAKDSRLSVVCAVSGGKFARRNFDVRLDGEGASLSLLGLAILDGAEQSHNYVRVTHAAQRCASFEHYKNILNGRAASSVDTTVTVSPGAQYVTSRQLINNLMFSPTAKAASKPRLMIRADDVKCNHGATVGRIDEDQVFYLKSRGLSEKEAKALIITGFAKEILNAIPAGPAADDSAALLLGKLGEGKVG